MNLVSRVNDFTMHVHPHCVAANIRSKRSFWQLDHWGVRYISFSGNNTLQDLEAQSIAMQQYYALHDREYALA
jgi:hypothetical protein